MEGEDGGVVSKFSSRVQQKIAEQNGCRFSRGVPFIRHSISQPTMGVYALTGNRSAFHQRYSVDLSVFF
jgi:hypothetical protein